MNSIYYKHRDKPPIILAFALGYMAFVIDNSVNTYAIGIILFAQFIRNWSRRYIGEHSRGATVEAPELLQSGPYSISRNPLYVSNILFGLGLVTLMNIWGIGIFVIVILYGVHYVVVASIEERFLIKKFGRAYDGWAKRTPRFLGFQFNYTEGYPERSFIKAYAQDFWTWAFQYSAVAVFLML